MAFWRKGTGKGGNRGGGKSANQTLYCSFCGKSQHEVQKLIAGPTVFICDECVALCQDIMTEEHKTDLTPVRAPMSWVEIMEQLDRQREGQRLAKSLLAAELREHYEKIDRYPEDFEIADAPRGLLLWGSGLQRIETLRAVKRIVNVPFVAIDSIKLIRLAAACGPDETILDLYLQAADFHEARRGHGIAVINDIDRLGPLPGDRRKDRNATALEVQKAVARLIKSDVPPLREGGGALPDVGTGKMLFLLGGSFAGPPAIEEVDSNIPEDGGSPPLSTDQRSILLDFGLLPELVESFSGVIPIE